MSSDEPDFVRALARGLEVIELFDMDHPSMSLSELATRACLSRGTVRRILITLETLGYVEKAGSKFRLRPRALRLGYAYLSSVRVWDLARPYLEAVNAELGETSSVAVLDGHEIVFVSRVAAKRIVKDYIPLGFRWPAYPTSLGRVLLASLTAEELDVYFASIKLEKLTEFTVVDETVLREKIRHVQEAGYASADRDIDPNLRSVAAPIFDRMGRIVAAINTNAQANKMSQDEIEARYVPVLKKAADAIGEVLKWQTTGFD